MFIDLEIIAFFTSWLADDDGKIIFYLSIIFIFSILDFLIGYINALFNKNVTFSSSAAIYGIAKKIIMFILLIALIPVSFIIEYPIGLYALYTLYTGYLISEIRSILAHLKIMGDGDKTNLFGDFLADIFKNKKKDE